MSTTVTVARLYNHIRPSRYVLDLVVDPAQFTNTVAETIEFELMEASRVLTFHATGFTVDEAQLVDGPAATQITTDMDEESPTYQTVSFHFEEELPAGRYSLKLKFTALIEETLHGFYRSRYEHDGQEKWLMTTQFEAVHAREAFVCIDEPIAKAVVEPSMTVPKGLTALTNNIEVREAPASRNRKQVWFDPTPLMSTYLGCFIVGEFEFVEGHTKRGTRVRVYATPGKKGQLSFALETAIRGLEFYEDYFGLPYPLKKLDMVAIPDFASGAMENWGLITYRETALLLDPQQTGLSQKQRVAEVILHELAHQWFGNSTTMSWWNDLWLNEGFASWMEVLAQSALFPEWNVWEMYASSDYSRALGDDALANTHPIEVEVTDPRALDEIFDAISYSKGSSVINMLHHWLGADKFQAGIQLYLKRHQWGNTETADLWAALGEASGKPVTEVMTAWTQRPGFPLVKQTARGLNQTRFYASPREAAKAPAAPAWPIPWDELVPNQHQPRTVLMREHTTPLAASQAPWSKPNPGQTGFYRTLYSPQMVAALERPLTNGTLGAVDRYGVVSDVFATTQAGLTDSHLALGLLRTLRGDANYVVASGLIGGLGNVLSVIEDDELRRRFEGFGSWFVRPLVDKLGWTAADGESSFDTLLRPAVIGRAVRFDDPAVTKEAQRRYQRYLKDGTIDPNLRSPIYYATARHGDAADWETMLKLYRKEQIPQVKLQLLSQLCQFRKPELIQRALELGLSKDVRPAETIYTVAYSFTREGRELAWQFVQDNWPVFLERYGSGGHMLDYFVSYVGGAFASHERAEEIERFFADRPHPAITRAVAQAVEATHLRADWYERDRSAIEQFLTEWENGATA